MINAAAGREKLLWCKLKLWSYQKSKYNVHCPLWYKTDHQFCSVAHVVEYNLNIIIIILINVWCYHGCYLVRHRPVHSGGDQLASLAGGMWTNGFHLARSPHCSLITLLLIVQTQPLTLQFHLNKDFILSASLHQKESYLLFKASIIII